MEFAEKIFHIVWVCNKKTEASVNEASAEYRLPS